MNRWLWFMGCLGLGAAMIFCGLLMPIHLRAVNAEVLAKAGRGTPSLIEQGQGLLMAQGVGAAQLLQQAAQAEKLPGENKLEPLVTRFSREHPDWLAWGGADAYLDKVFKSGPGSSNAGPFMGIIIRPENRRMAVEHLRLSSSFAVQQLLYCRVLTNTVIFPPPQSASGQAFEAALLTTGLLLTEMHVTPGLSNAVLKASLTANRDGNSQPLELVLLDMMSLGQRMNWGQLAMFVGKIEDTETLRRLAADVRKSDAQLPVIFAAVQLSGNPAEVAGYLDTFSQTGLKNLGASLRFGTGGIKELLRRNQQPYDSPVSRTYVGRGVPGKFLSYALDWSLRWPMTALSLKWFFYLAGGFLIAAALHFARPAVSSLEEPLQVRGFHVAREILFALGFLLVVLLLSEPFLAQESQKAATPFRLRPLMVGGAVPAGSTGAKTSIMNQPILSLLTLLVFFVLQGLLYISCLVKLAEIRRQRIAPAVKLKLLENEEHLFDAGLYLGFAGTIVSLIFVSLHIINFSLMAAYSSTSFGIIFVSIFKIFHLRPARRLLLLEANAEPREMPVQMAEASASRP